MAPSRHEFVLPNGNKFYIRRYDAYLSLKILGEVQKKFLSPMASLMEANDTQQDTDARLRIVFEMIEKISLNLDGDILVELAKKILNPDYISVAIEGEQVEKLNEGLLNRAIDGIADLIGLVIETLKVNYVELFTRGKALIGQAQSGMESR
jgi:hypothetical protein